MFFGKPVEVARFDIPKYPIFAKLAETQRGFMWSPEEIDITQDKMDFEELSEAEQHVFTSNIKYQILLDTVQGREPSKAFLDHASEPEIEDWIQTWAFFETIHSRSYTHIIRGIYANPGEVFDTIMTTPEIQERAESINRYYDRLKNDPNYDNLYLCMNAVNVLEGVRFFVSFACSFAFGERKMMVGNADIIKLIARDENVHLSATQNLLKQMELEHPELKEKHQTEVYDMFWEASQQEIEWAGYLFKDGAMLGLNKDILSTYVQYITDRRMKQLGMKPFYSVKENPLPWMSSWLTSDNVQVAPQEREITTYIDNAVDNKFDTSELTGFKL
jgi:ribonucleoside-diphosphate reductase beta chain